MSWSVNELAGLAEKAARGAGAPLEQARWFGRAAAVHLGAGRDPEDLAQALADLPGGAILTLHLAVTEAQLEANPSATLRTEVPQALVRSYLETLPFHVEISTAQDALRVAFDRQRPAGRPPLTRVTPPEALACRLQDLAARTLVPESDASRRSGAGAGLLDND